MCFVMECCTIFQFISSTIQKPCDNHIFRLDRIFHFCFGRSSNMRTLGVICLSENVLSLSALIIRPVFANRTVKMLFKCEFQICCWNFPRGDSSIRNCVFREMHNLFKLQSNGCFPFFLVISNLHSTAFLCIFKHQSIQSLYAKIGKICG